MSLSRGVNQLLFLFNKLNISSVCSNKVVANRIPILGTLTNISNKLHTSCVRRDLMEFFEEKENWGKNEVIVGRPWSAEELRIKSNSDLHKLWFVLLKERNMLLTMQEEYHKKNRALPSEERIDKVEISMENLEKVVRERNRAYFELETGETGERPVVEDVNCFGLKYKRKLRQHLVEKRFNRKYLSLRKLYNDTDDHRYIELFLQKLKEKKNRRLNYVKKLQEAKVCNMLKRFPDVDLEALQNEYPLADIEKARKHKSARGNRENPY